LERIDLDKFSASVSGLEDGQFVRFKATAMTMPVYVNPYLAIRQQGTLATILPSGRARSASEREAAEAFLESLGPEPRVVFSSRSSRDDRVLYLMPAEAQLLSGERSLLKYGGGEFTVVGKVVRIFPEQGDQHHPPYVDSATEATWEGPIKAAPGTLICQADPGCARQLRTVDAKGRRGAIAASRRRNLEALRRQTLIPEEGAVILPVAIYK
jgi:hypothetical protein